MVCYLDRMESRNRELAEAIRSLPIFISSFAVSLEAIFLSLLILMSQSREMRQSDQRAKLELQINLLAEQETTKLLEMVRELCRVHNLSIAEDAELAELLDKTNPEALVEELKEADDQGV